MPIDIPTHPDGVPMDDVAASLNKDITDMEAQTEPSTERPITVAEIIPFLSDRGTIEVDSAIKSFRLQIAQQQLVDAQQQIVRLLETSVATEASEPEPKTKPKYPRGVRGVKA